MSPSWRERIEIFIGADAVILARFARGLRRPSAQRQSFEVGAGNPRWRAALEALQQGLDALPRAAGAEADVTVSNHFVCFALVADADKLRNDGEREAAARHTLRTIYGEAAATWRVVLDGSGGRGAAVAAGIEAEFVEGTLAALSRARIRPQRLQPLFSGALNECGKVVGNGRAWFGVAEPGRLALAYLERGACRAVRTHRLRGALAQELPILLEQDRLTGLPAESDEAAGGRVVLAAREPLILAPELTGTWSVVPVPLRMWAPATASAS